MLRKCDTPLLSYQFTQLLCLPCPVTAFALVLPQFEKWNNVTQPPQLVDVVSGPLPNRSVTRLVATLMQLLRSRACLP